MAKSWPPNTFKKQASHKPHKNLPGNVTISPCQKLTSVNLIYAQNKIIVLLETTNWKDKESLTSSSQKP